MTALRLFGRPGSHFTRVARIFADECGVDVEFVVVADLGSVDPADYGGNPCLKVPTLQTTTASGATTSLWGTEHICRALHGRAARPPRVAWPVADNAHELLRHAMDAEVNVILGQHPHKARASLERALAWLDAHVDDVVAALPSPRELSFFEVALFCLLEHLPFRRTASLDGHLRLQAFVDARRDRPSARRTAYREIG